MGVRLLCSILAGLAAVQQAIGVRPFDEVGSLIEGASVKKDLSPVPGPFTQWVGLDSLVATGIVERQQYDVSITLRPAPVSAEYAILPRTFV